MKNIALLISISFFIFSQAGFAGDKTASKSDLKSESKSDWQGIPEKWRACTIDSDCIAGVESCLYWEAINKQYIKALSKSLNGCSASVDPGFQPVTVCVHKACQATDRTTDVSWEDWLNEMRKLKVK